MDFSWESIKPFAFVAVIIAHGAFVFGRKWLAHEISRNESHEAPSEQQLKWDIRHMREDLHALVLINYAVLCIALYALFFR